MISYRKLGKGFGMVQEKNNVSIPNLVTGGIIQELMLKSIGSQTQTLRVKGVYYSSKVGMGCCSGKQYKSIV